MRQPGVDGEGFPDPSTTGRSIGALDTAADGTVRAATAHRWPRIAGGAALLALGAAFIVLNRAQIPEAARAFRDANHGWLAAGLALSIANLIAYAGLHGASQRALEVRLPWRALARTATAAQFLNITVVNSGGLGGLPLMISRASRAGQSPARATTAYLLAAELGHLMFAAALVPALVMAYVNHEITRAEWLASIVFGVYTAGSLALVVAGLRSRAAVAWLEALPRRIRGALRRGRRRAAAEEPPPVAAGALYEAFQVIVARPSAVIWPAVWALAVEACGVAMLWAVLLAFHGTGAPLSTAFFAYCMGIVFSAVGFLPGGLGFAEAGLGLALVSGGIPGPEAALSVVVYRVLETWIPFSAGGVAAFHGGGAG